MGYRDCIRVLTLLFVLSRPSHADDSALSVYEIHPWIDGPVSVTAALGAGVPIFFENQLIQKSAFLNRDDLPGIDRSAAGNHNSAVGFGSHLVVGAALVAPVIYDYTDVGWNRVYLEDMVVYTQTLAIQSAIANLARFGTKRARPDAYGMPQPVDQAQEFESFYSGHTASMFAGLTAMSITYTYRHGPSPWPWVITVVSGFGQGAMRVIAGRHFPTDVLAGAAVGGAIGTLVPVLHHRSRNSDVSVLPSFGADNAGLVFQKKF
jgi:membrane-associated phospholipid phosphatase